MPTPSFTVHGPSDGPGILLVHGLGVSGKYFRPLIRLLSGSYRVVTPDLPGFGTSAHLGPALTIPGQAEAMERVVDLVGLDRPVLLGHSMGAQVVTEMAVRRPGRTRGVALVGPVVDPALPTAFDQGWRLARDSVREPFPLKALTTREFFRARPRTYRQSLTHMLAYRILDRVAEVTAPVEVLRGSHDPIASRSFADALAAAASSGRAYEIPGARHMAVATRADMVANLCHRVWPSTPRSGTEGGQVPQGLRG
ncbi:alpha/beta fold hydrolase [Aquipuribacter sp. MA13-6]|uniref:alpha/beta fold hydrolase n=1 Tax=unclassified Aquipuribacter TaxID=2635084 RepID=UPI003EEF0BBA